MPFFLFLELEFPFLNIINSFNFHDIGVIYELLFSFEGLKNPRFKLNNFLRSQTSKW
jgi:hypothetical protein